MFTFKAGFGAIRGRCPVVMFALNGFRKPLDISENKFEFNLMNLRSHDAKSVQLWIVIKSTHIAGSEKKLYEASNIV